jgi:hypothetical protein
MYAYILLSVVCWSKLWDYMYSNVVLHVSATRRIWRIRGVGVGVGVGVGIAGPNCVLNLSTNTFYMYFQIWSFSVSKLWYQAFWHQIWKPRQTICFAETRNGLLCFFSLEEYARFHQAVYSVHYKSRVHSYVSSASTILTVEPKLKFEFTLRTKYIFSYVKHAGLRLQWMTVNILVNTTNNVFMPVPCIPGNP